MRRKSRDDMVAKRDKKPFIQNLGAFTTAAHRGTPREFPANTIESFARALDIHAGALLEMDVWETRDGHAVVMHDGMLECATDGCGSVDTLTLEELQQLDAGHATTFDGGTSHPFRGKGYRIPSLVEVLESFPRVPKSIDIKFHRPGFARRVMALIESRGETDTVIMGSFNAGIVRLIRREYPAAATCVTTPGLIFFLLMQKLGASRLCPIRGDAFSIPEFAGGKHPEDQGAGWRQGIRIITPSFIRAAHRRGLPVLAWTINREENMRRLIKWGVDGIITDRIDALKKIIFP